LVYTCCEPQLEWVTQKSSDSITIDLRPLLEERKDHLEVSGHGGTLFIWPITLEGERTGDDGKGLKLRNRNEIQVMFYPEQLTLKSIRWRQD
jgi:hypothetical protein